MAAFFIFSVGRTVTSRICQKILPRTYSKNVNDDPNGKLINILKENYLKKRAAVERAVFTSERKVALCMYVQIYSYEC